MEGNSFNPPKKLVFDGEASNWEKFIQNFNIYMIATGLISKTDEVKVAIFLNLAGEEAVDVFNTFKLSEDDKKNFETVKKAFEEYCIPRKNVVYDRFKFFSRVQKEGEAFDHFLTDLKMLSRQCNFGDQEESLIRDRIVIGINDAALQERLLRVSELSLNSAINQCRAAEAGKAQVKTLQDKTIEVAAIKKKQFIKGNISTSSGTANKSYDCLKCGKNHKPRECPAYGKQCAICGNKNHFAVKCRSNKKKENIKQKETSRQRVQEVNVDEDKSQEDSEESLFLDVK